MQKKYMYDDKNKFNSMYLKKKNKNRKTKLYIFLILISIIIFYIIFSINTKNDFKKTNKNVTENIKKYNSLPPKPKEKWKYVKKLEEL